uniref:Acyltransferase n=1 Tax=Panagrellus redivivus TaxID=6233 RepID=A0A7E5A1P0_PANRE
MAAVFEVERPAIDDDYDVLADFTDLLTDTTDDSTVTIFSDNKMLNGSMLPRTEAAENSNSESELSFTTAASNSGMWDEDACAMEDDFQKAYYRYIPPVETAPNTEPSPQPSNITSRVIYPRIETMHWAPVDVPLERRLQTAACTYFIWLFIAAPFVTPVIALYVLFFTSYWWISALYAIWFAYDWHSPERGAYAQEWFRRQRVWEYLAAYFPAKLVKTIDLDPNENYIIGGHPHGILAISSFISICTEATGWSDIFPGISSHLVTLGSQFMSPIRREMILMCGIISSNKRAIEYLLGKDDKKGKAVTIILGGAEEALDCRPDSHILRLSMRKGFVRLALENGAHLVPMFNFGENKTYRQVENNHGTKLRTFQTKFKEYFGFSPPLFMGRGIFNYSFGLLPFRTNITSVVGAPIKVTKIPKPTPEEIDELHAKYCDALRHLFDENKLKYGLSEDSHLTIL